MTINDIELRGRMGKVEKIMQEEVGRNLPELFLYSNNGLHNVADTLAKARSPYIGIITGFYIPQGNPPSGETDGPLGAAMLMQFFEKIGIRTRLMTDEPCQGACAAALQGANVTSPFDVVPPGMVKTYYRKWKRLGVSHVLSIERCGRSDNGPPRNMRGKDISSYTVSFDSLYRDGPWKKLAIGDGGNEIGMGLIPKKLIAQNIANGSQIACVTPADKNSLIVAGVSNWGAYALIAAMALIKPEWTEAALGVLSEQNNTRILEAMVTFGPSVDGVSGEQKPSVDGMDLAKHNAIIASIREIILGNRSVAVRNAEGIHGKLDLRDVANGPG